MYETNSKSNFNFKVSQMLDELTVGQKSIDYFLKNKPSIEEQFILAAIERGDNIAMRWFATSMPHFDQKKFFSDSANREKLKVALDCCGNRSDQASVLGYMKETVVDIAALQEGVQNPAEQMAKLENFPSKAVGQVGDLPFGGDQWKTGREPDENKLFAEEKLIPRGISLRKTQRERLSDDIEKETGGKQAFKTVSRRTAFSHVEGTYWKAEQVATILSDFSAFCRGKDMRKRKTQARKAYCDMLFKKYGMKLSVAMMMKWASGRESRQEGRSMSKLIPLEQRIAYAEEYNRQKESTEKSRLMFQAFADQYKDAEGKTLFSAPSLGKWVKSIPRLKKKLAVRKLVAGWKK